MNSVVDLTTTSRCVYKQGKESESVEELWSEQIWHELLYMLARMMPEIVL